MSSEAGNASTRHRSARAPAVAAIVATLALATAVAAVATDEAFASECFAPDAQVPYVFADSKQAFAYGNIYCPYDWSSFTFDVKLLNRAGNILIRRTGGPRSGWGYHDVFTDIKGCAGAYVRSGITINTHGFLKSDDSAETGACTY
jgi:hypothetical protein